jgi:AhpD family alkylhydroperoxidase
MSESPELLNGFLTLRSIFYRGSFTPGEVQVLALTNAFANGCSYCLAFHSALALKEGVSKDVVEALRTGRPPQEPTHRALSELSRTLVTHRGRAGDDDLQRFIAAGYSKAQALEVVLGIAVSILPNYAHHITHCPLDGSLSAHRWTTADAETQSALLG